MGVGFAVSLGIWVRGRGPAGGLAALFALGALRQGAMMLSDSSWPLPADAQVIGEIALSLAGLAGLVALRSLWKTTQDLDRAEDLHWDSMEAVRLVSELAAHPGASLEEKLARVLELGTERFELDYAIACRPGDGETQILASRAPEGGLSSLELAAALEPQLRLAAESPRVCAVQTEKREAASEFAAFLAAPVRAEEGAPVVLAFAGARGSDDRFTATDKDLIALMAQWLRSELLLRARAPQRGAQRPDAAERSADRLDLNTLLRRAESRLRAQLSAPASLELSLAPVLPPLRPTPVAAETLALSLVAAAQGLSPAGALRVETSRLASGSAPADADPFVTLSVRVRDASIRPDALEHAFAADPTQPPPRGASGGALPLAQLESLLRRGGADLSVQVEPGRGATLTAYLPARRAPKPPAREEAAALPAPGP